LRTGIFNCRLLYMQQETYTYKNILSGKYSFTSMGKKQIVKIVEFTPTVHENIVNLGFGDMLPDTKFDDLAVSNNGDIIKVIATVIGIVQEFTGEFPELTVMVRGSTTERTKLYSRILKMYYAEFSKEFHISGLIEDASGVFKVDFDPIISRNYKAYFVKRKS